MDSSSVLDIVRQSSGLLCSSLLPTLLLITLVLIFPVSSISLSQVMTNSQLAGQMSVLLTRHLALVGIHISSLTSLFYLQLSQTLLSQAMCFPVILTLWMLAKTAIFYLLACRDRGKEASVMGFLEWGPPAWCRIAATYLWGCLLVVLITAILLLLEVAGAMLLRIVTGTLMEMENLESSLYAILETGVMSAYAIVLAPMIIILNLGSVVAGMEETKCGPRALLRVLTLLKRRRLQPALLLFLITGIAITGIEGAFQYRVLGRATLPVSGPASSLVEAPFLIFAHSFLLLLDTIMSAVFYYACQSAADASLFLCRKNKQEEEEEEEDHFSIAVHVLEQQCRKMFTSTGTLI
ncbi:hypothetical protein L7F22_021719 [Adiantum nelumboides]|nr:hypothetical protein [Adiantum nelumboides]